MMDDTSKPLTVSQGISAVTNKTVKATKAPQIIRPASALTTSNTMGAAKQQRVLLASQQRTDSFHMSRLSRLSNEAHVRKSSTGTNSGVTPVSNTAKRPVPSSITQQLSKIGYPALRPGQASSVQKTQTSSKLKFQNASQSRPESSCTNQLSKPSILTHTTIFKQSNNTLGPLSRSPLNGWSKMSRTPTTATIVSKLPNFTKSDQTPTAQMANKNIKNMLAQSRNLSMATVNSKTESQTRNKSGGNRTTPTSKQPKLTISNTASLIDPVSYEPHSRSQSGYKQKLDEKSQQEEEPISKQNCSQEEASTSQLNNVSYINLLTTSISSNPQQAKRGLQRGNGNSKLPPKSDSVPFKDQSKSTAIITSNYYKQIEMSKAARERRKKDNSQIQCRLNQGTMSIPKKQQQASESSVSANNLASLQNMQDFLSESSIMKSCQRQSQQLPMPEPKPEKPIFATSEVGALIEQQRPKSSCLVSRNQRSSKLNSGIEQRKTDNKTPINHYKSVHFDTYTSQGPYASKKKPGPQLSIEVDSRHNDSSEIPVGIFKSGSSQKINRSNQKNTLLTLSPNCRKSIDIKAKKNGAGNLTLENLKKSSSLEAKQALDDDSQILLQIQMEYQADPMDDYMMRASSMQSIPKMKTQSDALKTVVNQSSLKMATSLTKIQKPSSLTIHPENDHSVKPQERTVDHLLDEKLLDSRVNISIDEQQNDHSMITEKEDTTIKTTPMKPLFTEKSISTIDVKVPISTVANTSTLSHQTPASRKKTLPASRLTMPTQASRQKKQPVNLVQEKSAGRRPDTTKNAYTSWNQGQRGQKQTGVKQQQQIRRISQPQASKAVAVTNSQSKANPSVQINAIGNSRAGSRLVTKKAQPQTIQQQSRFQSTLKTNPTAAQVKQKQQRSINNSSIERQEKTQPPRPQKHNFRPNSTTRCSMFKNNGKCNITTSAEKKRSQRKASLELLIPKLDLSKAAPFANLPDPYAYLREEIENKSFIRIQNDDSNIKQLSQNSQTEIEKTQVQSVCSSDWNGHADGNQGHGSKSIKQEKDSIQSFEQKETKILMEDLKAQNNASQPQQDQGKNLQNNKKQENELSNILFANKSIPFSKPLKSHQSSKKSLTSFQSYTSNQLKMSRFASRNASMSKAEKTTPVLVISDRKSPECQNESDLVLHQSVQRKDKKNEEKLDIYNVHQESEFTLQKPRSRKTEDAESSFCVQQPSFDKKIIANYIPTSHTQKEVMVLEPLIPAKADPPQLSVPFDQTCVSQTNATNATSAQNINATDQNLDASLQNQLLANSDSAKNDFSKTSSQIVNCLSNEHHQHPEKDADQSLDFVSNQKQKQDQLSKTAATSSAQDHSRKEREIQSSDSNVSKEKDQSTGKKNRIRYLTNFSIQAIWQEMERIKSHKQQVDNNYQRVMRQLQTPDISPDKPLQTDESSKKANLSQSKSQASIQKRDIATSMTTLKHRATSSASSLNSKTPTNAEATKTAKVDAETSPFSMSKLEQELEDVQVEPLSSCQKSNDLRIFSDLAKDKENSTEKCANKSISSIKNSIQNISLIKDDVLPKVVAKQAPTSTQNLRSSQSLSNNTFNFSMQHTSQNQIANGNKRQPSSSLAKVNRETTASSKQRGALKKQQLATHSSKFNADGLDTMQKRSIANRWQK